MNALSPAAYGAGKPERGSLRAPSLRQTFAYAAQSIRLRFGRCLITMACVVGAIAFLTYNALGMRGGPPPAVAPAPATAEALDTRTDAAGLSAGFFAGLEEFTAEKSAAQKRLFVVALSLLVSLVGITNSMLMAIKERYREIATLKCLGALNAYIRRLFMIESVMQGAVGSALGVALGFFLHLLAQEQPAPAAWALKTSLACLGVGVAMTLVAAVWPIRTALAMLPIEALRVEE